MNRDELKTNREFLKDCLRLTIDFRMTEQNRGIVPPPVQKPVREGQTQIPLPDKESFSAFAGTDLLDAIARRRSRRRFRAKPLTLTELAFLLWATQGISQELGPDCALRTVPSAGCRHAFETYLLVTNVKGLEPGIYRYLPAQHALVYEQTADRLQAGLVPAVLGQSFVAEAPVAFVWAVIPHRMEWRYHTAAHRVIAMDVGHVCQNLYLACEAIGAGSCAIAAYHQELMDRLLGIDGDEEFTLYLAPVGKI
jgi:SagB-type dehydrogenase family enzyme